MTPQPPLRFDLNQLGWLAFERLASLVIAAETGLGDLPWRGDADVGRHAVVDDDVVLSDARGPLRGPVSVAVVWVRDGDDASALVGFAERVAQLPITPDGHLLLVTNLDETRARTALRTQVGAALGRAVILDRRRIAASLDRHGSIRAAMPCVLGLGDLRHLMRDEIVAGSTLDVGAARDLSRVFWPTRAYDRALGVLRTHGFVVLTGPPEMGKTAIAQMLALALMTDGWEALECSHPEQVWRAFDPQRHQVFVADDAFGSTEYRPDAGERWAVGLGRLLTMLDPQHWLIWTSRPAPLKAGLHRLQSERGSARFPAPGEVLVDASELDLAEKTLILFRHAKHQALGGHPRGLVRAAGTGIVEHPHFTPERIRRFVSGRLAALDEGVPAGDRTGLLEAIEQELASPTAAMRTSFDALEPEHRDLLVALLDAPAGLIDERELTGTVRRHHAGGLSRPPGELIDRLTDHFLRVTPLGIGWVHPSWRDLVIEQLRAHPRDRQRFLASCGIDGAMLALSQAGGAAGERSFPLLISDEDWDALGDRAPQLLGEMDERSVARLLHGLVVALESAGDARQRREATTLAGGCLTALKRAWARRAAPVALLLLEAWFTLNATTGEPLEPPDLGLTWIELHPGATLAEPLSRTELGRVDDWLALAELLHHHAPATLAPFGFPDRDRTLIAEAIPVLARAAMRPDLAEVAEGVLLRIERLVPAFRAGTRGAIEVGRFAGLIDAGRWWVPDDLLAPPTSERVSPDPFRPQDVTRVLDDL